VPRDSGDTILNAVPGLASGLVLVSARSDPTLPLAGLGTALPPTVCRSVRADAPYLLLLQGFQSPARPATILQLLPSRDQKLPMVSPEFSEQLGVNLFIALMLGNELSNRRH
jgi:hypothetical protein